MIKYLLVVAELGAVGLVPTAPIIWLHYLIHKP